MQVPKSIRTNGTRSNPESNIKAQASLESQVAWTKMATDVTGIETRSRTPTGHTPIPPQQPTHRTPHPPQHPYGLPTYRASQRKVKGGRGGCTGEGKPSAQEEKARGGEVRGPEAKRDRETTTLRQPHTDCLLMSCARSTQKLHWETRVD